LKMARRHSVEQNALARIPSEFANPALDSTQHGAKDEQRAPRAEVPNRLSASERTAAGSTASQAALAGGRTPPTSSALSVAARRRVRRGARPCGERRGPTVRRRSTSCTLMSTRSRSLPNNSPPQRRAVRAGGGSGELEAELECVFPPRRHRFAPAVGYRGPVDAAGAQPARSGLDVEGIVAGAVRPRRRRPPNLAPGVFARRERPPRPRRPPIPVPSSGSPRAPPRGLSRGLMADSVERCRRECLCGSVSVAARGRRPTT